MIKQDELLFVVDDNNNPLKPKPRSFVHKKNLWHRTTNVWIINSQKQILCQQRSWQKDKAPGFWEAFFGGHLPLQTDYLTNAVQETNEELGFQLKRNDLRLFTIYKADSVKEFQAVYIISWNGNEKKIQFEKEEIEKIKWFSFEDIKHTLLIKKDPQWTFYEYIPELFSELELSFNFTECK